ncbi:MULTISPECIES: hypothetical protein [unclassified Novosphingobium]|uniref:hypothetical protein n=1 Tax=unclassified Novosphingobium TaxID=2644732 RepID=UPI001359C4EE|nr:MULTISPECIES: hypothetical protein [unclassified Novosphingobium]
MGLWRRYLDWRKRNVFAIDTGGDGFRVRHGRETCEVSWSGIEAVLAFKRDLLTVDRLCVAVVSDGSAMELDECMEGFEPWLLALENRLEIAGEWRLRVLFPVFETNMLEIFRRDPMPAGLREAT